MQIQHAGIGCYSHRGKMLGCEIVEPEPAGGRRNMKQIRDQPRQNTVRNQADTLTRQDLAIRRKNEPRLLNPSPEGAGET